MVPVTPEQVETNRLLVPQIKLEDFHDFHNLTLAPLHSFRFQHWGHLSDAGGSAVRCKADILSNSARLTASHIFGSHTWLPLYRLSVAGRNMP
jgi:hypothetical protein